MVTLILKRFRVEPPGDEAFFLSCCAPLCWQRHEAGGAQTEDCVWSGGTTSGRAAREPHAGHETGGRQRPMAWSWSASCHSTLMPAVTIFSCQLSQNCPASCHRFPLPGVTELSCQLSQCCHASPELMLFGWCTLGGPCVAGWVGSLQ